MQPKQLIANGGNAIKGTKYYTGGANAERRNRPVSRFELRYATAAMVQLLTDLADLDLRLTPEGLRWWAEEIERAGETLDAKAES